MERRTAPLGKARCPAPLRAMGKNVSVAASTTEAESIIVTVDEVVDDSSPKWKAPELVPADRFPERCSGSPRVSAKLDS